MLKQSQIIYFKFIVLILILFLTINKCFSSFNYKQKPNLVSRLSNRGIDFFGLIGHKLVSKELPKAIFPNISLPINSGPGSGQVTVSGLHIIPSQFISPKFKFQLAPPKAIRFISNNGIIPIRGLWSAFYWIAGIKFSTNGWIELIAENINSALELGILHSNSRPQFEVFSCYAANVDNIQMEIGGGVIPWIVNLFRTQLSNALKQELNEQFCQIVHSTLLGQLNNLLISLPTTFALGDTLFLNYAFDNDPQVTSTFIESTMFTDVLVQNNSDICPFGPKTELDVLESGRKWMTSIWIHSSVPNCLFWSMHNANILQITIGPNFTSENLKRYLQTSCHIYQICLGTFFPKLAKEYPNNHIDFHFHSMNPPILYFISLNNENNILLDTKFFVDLHISPWKNNSKILARLDFNGTAIIEPFFENTRIKGNLKDLQVKFSEINSSIGNFSETFLHKFSLLCVPILEAIFKSSLNIGIPLPSVEDIRLSSESELSIIPKSEQIRIDANLEYINNLII